MPNGFVPGSGGNNAGYAVVYPDNDLQRMQIANNMHQANLAQQQRIEQQQQQDEAHRYALNKYYGGQFDFDKFDTGTDLNKSINDLLVSGKKQFMDVLNQPGASDEDIANAADQALTPAMKMYQMGTAIKRNIDGTVAGYDKKDGIDTGSLSKQAYINAIYTKDDKTGKYRLKNENELNQIDPEHNYAADVVNNTPWLVSKGNVDLEGGFKSMIPQTVKNSGEYYDSKGIKHKGSYEAQIYQGVQDIVPDAKGVNKVVTVNNPIPVTDEKGNAVIDPKTGKQAVINQVPDVVLNHFQKTPGQKASLDVATINYLKSHPVTANESAIPGTPGFEIAKKAMLYDMVDNYGAKRINSVQGEQAPAFVIKNMLGIPQGGNQTPVQQNDIHSNFNDISTDKFLSDNGAIGKIENGVLNENGSMIGFPKKFNTSGTITGTMPLDAIPTSLRNAVTKYSQGNDIVGVPGNDRKKTPTDRVRVQITNGQLSGVMTKKGEWFGVNDRTNGDITINNKNVSMKQKEQLKPNSNATSGGNVYVDTRLVNGVKWGKKADGTIEKIK